MTGQSCVHIYEFDEMEFGQKIVRSHEIIFSHPAGLPRPAGFQALHRPPEYSRP